MHLMASARGRCGTLTGTSKAGELQGVKIPRRCEQSSRVLSHLTGWDFPPEVQQRSGALAVVWGTF